MLNLFIQKKVLYGYSAGVAIVKNAPNMENAKKFIDWLISDEGQFEI